MRVDQLERAAGPRASDAPADGELRARPAGGGMSDADDLERRWRFVLGESGDEECAALEELLFVGDEQALAMASAEDDLIDAYVRAELDDERRRRFEARFTVTPEQRARLAFAKALVARSAAGSAAGAATASPLAPATLPRELHPGGRGGEARVRRRWMRIAAALLVATLVGVGWRMCG